MSERNATDSNNLPAIVGDAEVARILGMHEDWLSLLEAKGHLRSLGGRGRGCQRFYASCYVVALKQDEEWLDRAVKLVRNHFRTKNAHSGGPGE
jgi:hypothetical protein